MARAFVTGGTGVIGTALVTALLARGDEVVGLARSDASAQTLRERGIETVHGETWDQEAMTGGMQGCDIAFHVAGVNSLCVTDPAPMEHANVDGAVAAVRAAAAAGVRRLVHTSSAATIGEPAGTIGTEWTKPRGWFLSTYERTKTEGEDAALQAARETGQDIVCVNPSSVQGPGRASGTGRFLLAFLDGRLKVFVNTHVSLVDIGDCVEGHLLAAERGKRVLLVEVDAKGNLTALFEHAPVGFDPVEVYPGVYAMQMQTEASLREYLKLHRPIYQKTAAYGHFGREDPDFTWEATDKAATLREAAGLGAAVGA